MIRQNQRFLTQVYVLTDLVCALLVFLGAYWLKFHSGLLSHYSALPFKSYLIWGTVYAFAAVIIGFYIGHYAPRRRKRFSFDVLKIVQVHCISGLLVLSLLYITRETHISREFLGLYFAASFVSNIGYRLAVKRLLFILRRKGYNKRYVLILGAGSVGRRFHNRVASQSELGYEVYGFLDDYQQEPMDADGAGAYKPIIGRLDELEKTLADNPVIDEVIVALPLEAHAKYAEFIQICDKAGVKTLIIPDFFDLLPARPFFDNFAGMPLINVRDIPLDELSNRLLKRTFDILFSLVAIAITSPVMLAIYLGIKLTSPGPVLFKQERVGFNRRSFMMFKFRSMHVSTGAVSDTQWTVENDPRRTAFGSFLRRTSLDELPQFFNVLSGQMSIVGPRPERPFFVEQFKEEVPRYMVKHHVRPGITGWAQTNGLRGDTSIEDRIVHDLFYLENWTFLFDIKIIMKTIVKGLVNKNAY
ncbi:Undecaprenyl-phosphate glucose phosphotransferase [Paenibacillus curdlanolyticus YK9]|uniref:Undecaprenyl-phosphate glucose phosphotransferase n=1 Tax=Paenibacillus curdlanolyticus YK9 TaxID=717606 RepID=E0IEP3_9BACL|nr:undecaprenyl-phosphate glucose phosphotransferase [Paenibacillus curdlanolyticus]EFM09131.1 Undecaprenyl-phosphate glucose phosphotransferase [Paenibacillus curdlanolyticus YK9]